MATGLYGFVYIKEDRGKRNYIFFQRSNKKWKQQEGKKVHGEEQECSTMSRGQIK